MLYSEFVEGTGCRDNEYNYKVYKNLEVMYMNSDMSKAEIYEYGKKLVDNRKTERELQVEAEARAEIVAMNERVAYLKQLVAMRTEWITDYLYDTEEEKKQYRQEIKRYKDEIKMLRQKARILREWFLK